MMKYMSIVLLLVVSFSAAGQSWMAKDSLIGYLNPYRAWYEVHYYDLTIEVDLDRQTIVGENTLHFAVQHEQEEFMQVDLASHFTVQAITMNGQPLLFERKNTAIWIAIPELGKGSSSSLTIRYQGRPQQAGNAPWDGGFVWEVDPAGRPWIGVACEGEGAHIWWPCKDHFTDEPDSMRMTFIVPDTLLAVGNGRLADTQHLPGKKAFTWKVVHPINTYNVSLNIGRYAHFTDTFHSEVTGRPLLLSYYVLENNLEKARQHFKQVKPMLKCFETYFGPYPFYKDSYKLVETPYLGMEHQSGIAYGNKYQKGYAGFDQSGLGFDYIIIHESGHEWFGNSITAADLAEVWIHESFTTYSEAVYVECLYGEEKAKDYMQMQRLMVMNKKPMIGPMDVRFDGWTDDNDQYYKGALMLHTLRQALADDEQWWSLIRSFATDFAYQVTTTDSVIAYFNDRIDFDVAPFFHQYLRHSRLPVLEYTVTERNDHQAMSFRWVTDVKGFRLPIPIEGKMTEVSNQWTTLAATDKWNGSKPFTLPDYYVQVKRIK